MDARSSLAPEAPAGIHCSNPDCRTRAGERSRGHQSCRALLCGHCCQSAARAAAEAGEQRPICKVHARRVHTGHKAAPKMEPRTESSLSLPATATTNNANPTGPPAPTPPRSGEHEELDNLLEKRARLEQSLKRSLTMVIWYRNGCEPLRIAHEVTTFPLFQLQDFPELIAELGLHPSSYIDAYNVETGQWEQHKISTVRTVEQDQRLLYRIRPSLLDSLTDCPSLEQELSLQPPSKNLSVKRQPEPPTPPPLLSKQVRVLSSSTPVRAPPSASPQSAVVQNASASTDGVSPIQGTPSWLLTPPSNTPQSTSRTSHPNTSKSSNNVNGSNNTSNTSNVKRWPTDYTVHEIAEGFEAMAAIMKSDPNSRQKSAFEHVFPPCRYVKSTVGRAKLYWKRASKEIREHFLTLPREDPGTKWTHFVHFMDGRLVIDLGNEKVDGESMDAVMGNGNDTADEDERGNTNSPMGFANANRLNVNMNPNAQSNQPQINLQSPTTNLTAHAPLPLGRSPLSQPQHAPPMGGLLPNPNALTHHASAPTMTMPASFTIDRNLNINRSSSSLSGAIALPDV